LPTLNTQEEERGSAHLTNLIFDGPVSRNATRRGRPVVERMRRRCALHSTLQPMTMPNACTMASSAKILRFRRLPLAGSPACAVTKHTHVVAALFVGQPCSSASDVCYCGFLAPHFLVSSIQTPPAFSHSALVFASYGGKGGSREGGCKRQTNERQEKPFHGNFPCDDVQLREQLLTGRTTVELLGLGKRRRTTAADLPNQPDIPS